MFIFCSESTSTQSLAPMAPTLFFPHPMNPINPPSVCPLGLAFPNQEFKSSYSEFASLDVKAPEYELNLAKKMRQKLLKDLSIATTVEKGKKYAVNSGWRLTKHVLDEAGINLMTLNNDWVHYLKELGSLTLCGALSYANKGTCGEAAALSIIHSVQKQLKWGFRESITNIRLLHEDHEFVIYNAKLDIFQSPKTPIRNFEELQHVLQTLEPVVPSRPVIICDAWIDYHGVASEWLKHYKRRVIPLTDAEKVPGPFLQAIDRTLPSFRKDRDEFNATLRNNLKNTMLQIISHFKRDFTAEATAEGASVKSPHPAGMR